MGRPPGKPPGKRRRRSDIPGSIPGIALITFVVLKLTGVIAWSWWWVLSPMWISGIVAVGAFVALMIFLWRETQRRTRRWMEHFVSGEWLRDGLVPPRADVHDADDADDVDDADDSDPGEGQAR